MYKLEAIYYPICLEISVHIVTYNLLPSSVSMIESVFVKGDFNCLSEITKYCTSEFGIRFVLKFAEEIIQPLNMRPTGTILTKHIILVQVRSDLL